MDFNLQFYYIFFGMLVALPFALFVLVIIEYRNTAIVFHFS